jgi:hypothetical protein
MDGVKTHGLIVVVTFLAAAAPAAAQVFERDTTITGPRGRSVERDVRIERGPGEIDRQIRIRRPGGTFERDARIQRGFGPGPRGYYGPRPGYYVNSFVFAPPPPPVAFGFGAPFFSLFLGSPPPPPVVVAPPPVASAPIPPQAAVGPPRDAFADAWGRLHSLHANSRRDGCLSLGQLRDARALPGLVDRLEHDSDKNVRIAAAWALAEVGDSRAAVPLQRAALYDKKQDVRRIASESYHRLPPSNGTPTGAEPPPSSTEPLPPPSELPEQTPARASSTPPPPPRPEP